MTQFTGLTWDHPRGCDALRAAGFDELSWDVHPLEGFESTPIENLAEQYDLLVLDHPHLGDALAAGCLRPLDELFTAVELAAWARDAIGPSARSYTLGGRTWALPLDAATQVSARRPELLPEAPATWEDALALEVPSAPSLAGPHAFLSFCSMAVSLGGELDDDLSGDFFHRDIAVRAMSILSELARKAPAVARELNPIGLLELMSTSDELAYVPLVYGYVTYSPRLAFGAPPAAERVGSTIGGTGIAITRRCEPTPALLDHVRWLLSPETQRGFIPEHSGQPSARSAWMDAVVDDRAGGFYAKTLDTIERSWVRPRFAGYVSFQAQASAIIREGLDSDRPDNTGNIHGTIDTLTAAYRKARS